MDKILIVGHHSSHYRALDEILQSCGMAKALPSYVYGMTPQTLTAKLLQAATATDKNSQQTTIGYIQKNGQKFALSVPYAQPATPYAQKFPKKAWDNLSFDLLLSNAEQAVWGWSDENAVQLLEYWANFDEDMAFVLTYDKPDILLRQALSQVDIDELDDVRIATLLQSWVDYNKALLEFHQKYPHRCLLVNGEQVIESANEYVRVIAQKIDNPANFDEPNEQVLATVRQDKSAAQNQAMIDYFAGQVLEQHQAVGVLFEHLQEQADIALLRQTTVQALDLLKSAIKQQSYVVSVEQDLVNAQQALADGQVAWQADLDKIKAAHDKLQDLHHQDQEQLAVVQERLQGSEQENQLVISQLHQVQEELEKYYLDNQKYQSELVDNKKQVAEKTKQIDAEKAKLAELNEKLKKADSQLNEQKQQATQSKQQLADLQAKQKATDSLKQENKQLITQLHQVQEELEKYYLQNQQEQDKLKASQAQIADAKKLADERQKKLDELNQLKQKAEKEASEQKNQATEAKSKLATLESKLQKLQQDSQSASNVQKENELLITQLHQVQEELERYYLENQRLKLKEQSEPKKPIYYGAADRVKQDLPYRLGATMVNHSKSTKDLAKLPLALAQEYREFQKQQDTQSELPPIEDYQDSDEAEKVKKHLSYRLGKTLVDGMKSPKSVLDLPRKSLIEIVDFFKNKRGENSRIISNEHQIDLLKLNGFNIDVKSHENNVSPIWSKSIILATVDFLPHIGGISIMTHELANNMVEQGWNVVVVAKVRSYIPDGFEQKYTLFVDSEFKKQAKSGDKAIQEDRRISVMFQRIIKRVNACSILLLHPFYYGIGARDAASKAKINCSFYFHGFEIRSQLLGKYPKNLSNDVKSKKVHTLRERTLYSVATADNIFVNSNFTSKIFDGFSVKPSITVTGCGVSVSVLNRFRDISIDEKLVRKQKLKKILTNQQNDILLGFVGRLVSNKNVASIIELVKYNDRLNAVIVGVGPELDSLKKLSYDFNIQNRVIFKGTVTEEEKWDILQGIDFVVLMSKPDESTGHIEGFGIALLEGIIAGAVPVSSGTGGMLDIVDDEINGLVCSIGDEKSQADRLVEIYENQELYWSMQNKATEKLVKNFTWNIVSEKILTTITNELV